MPPDWKMVAAFTLLVLHLAGSQVARVAEAELVEQRRREGVGLVDKTTERCTGVSELPPSLGSVPA